ncbi:MAG: hypothetical protein AAGC65_01365 [Mucilaginibacter sp.]|uniref:hypothetical protein n=1 Tax=Mucilaginibacter sp. TaxID=1882438 RepID=UPI0031AEC7A0
MKSLYYKIIALLFLVIAINGCKPDEAINPKKIVPIPGYNDDNTPNTGDGLPLGPQGTVEFQIDGVKTTYTNVSYEVFYPHTPQAFVSPETGQINILGTGANPAHDLFSLIFLNSKAGTYDIFLINAIDLFGGDGDDAKVKVTTFSDGLLQGTFNANLTGDDNKTHKVIGSFNIKM